MSDRAMRSVLVGVTGGVAAWTMPYIIQQIRETLAPDVHVMMSWAAQKFVSPYTLRLYSHNEVILDAYQPIGDLEVPHVTLPQQADLFLIIPATANIVGKAAHAICDDLISTAIVAATCPVVFVPAMNKAMWENPGVQSNLRRLEELGYYVIAPSFGSEVAGGDASGGKSMPPFPVIRSSVLKVLELRRAKATT